jgi:hypothetical protein
VTVSLNEIETTLRKAALGAGWPLGLAEEVGRAAAWLCGFGIDGVAAALPALAAGPSLAEAARAGALWRFPGARAAAAGPSALDLLRAAGEGASAALEGVDAPLLLLGLAGVAAADAGGGFALDVEGRDSARGWARVGARTLALAGEAPAPGAAVALRRLAAAPAGRAPSTTRAAPDPTLWAQAAALADRLLVPASETSRARGAGAGLIDDD